MPLDRFVSLLLASSLAARLMLGVAYLVMEALMASLTMVGMVLFQQYVSGATLHAHLTLSRDR